MRLAVSLLALFLLAPSVAAQEATQDLRLRISSNDATAGGSIAVTVEARTSADRAPNTSLGSATIDLRFDPDNLVLASLGGGVDDADGYAVNASTISCNGLSGICLRLGITSSGIGEGVLDDPGYDVGTTFTEIATVGFTLNATSAARTSFEIDRTTLSVGYYDSANNSSGNGVIEDNTGTVGDDVVAFETVRDVSVRTATLDAGPNWYLVGMPGAGATLDDLVGPLWTQGFQGSDGGTNGASNVVFWSETTGGYVAPTDQSAVVSPGAGLFVYAYADEDFDGSDEAFPKTSTLSATPANDLGAPVNNVSPDPYLPTLPFDFSVTYTASSGAPEGDGWNLKSNPTDEEVDWDQAGWTRTNLSEVLYTWDPDNVGGAKYVTWTPSIETGDRGDGILAPLEGFWTEAMAASPVLIMPVEAYDPAASASREAALAPRVGLRVAGDVGGRALADEAFVAFFEGASAERDRFDAHELAGLTDTQLHLFTTLETGETFTTDVRPPLDKGAVEIPLDVTALAPEAGATSTLTLTWPELRGLASDVPVQLLDLQTETVVDLWTETEYTFSLSSTASRSAGGKDASPVERTLRGPQALGTASQSATASRSARRADASRFVLFLGAAAVLPVSEESGAEAAFGLAPPAPNPTPGTTRLIYSVASARDVQLAVYDMLGRAVSVVASGLHAPGQHAVVLDTREFSPGLYVVRLEAEGQAVTQSLTVVR